jgi:type IV pilus assembly protein PilE
MQAKKASGFTLIELMIVVAIIGILASLAYMNYARYGYRARRADGKEFLTRVAAAQERYYTNFNAYSASVTGVPPAGLGFATNLSTKGFYTVATANGLTGTTASYQLTASPVLGKEQEPTAATIDACKNLILDNAGSKTASGTNSNGDCW